MSKKHSFFERLSGSIHTSHQADPFDDDDQLEQGAKEVTKISGKSFGPPSAYADDEPATAGQLPVDLHQTGNEFVVRAFVAGVRPDELTISISRDRVEIEGSRVEREHVPEMDYFLRELFWGSFSRTIQLPEEVDVENSSATAKDGLLIIILPKLDKARQTKLRVKAG